MSLCKLCKNLSDAIAKGALLWAPIYSIGASLVSFYLTADGSAEAVPFRELLMRALVVISPTCIMAEIIGWTVFNRLLLLRKLGSHKAKLPKLPHFVPPGTADRMRHSHV